MWLILFSQLTKSLASFGMSFIICPSSSCHWPCQVHKDLTIYPWGDVVALWILSIDETTTVAYPHAGISLPLMVVAESASQRKELILFNSVPSRTCLGFYDFLFTSHLKLLQTAFAIVDSHLDFDQSSGVSIMDLCSHDTDELIDIIVLTLDNHVDILGVILQESEKNLINSEQKFALLWSICSCFAAKWTFTPIAKLRMQQPPNDTRLHCKQQFWLPNDFVYCSSSAVQCSWCTA